MLEAGGTLVDEGVHAFLLVLRGDAMPGVYCVANASVSLDAKGRPLPAEPALWMGGARQAQLRQRGQVLRTVPVPGMALDNHWIALERGS